MRLLTSVAVVLLLMTGCAQDATSSPEPSKAATPGTDKALICLTANSAGVLTDFWNKGVLRTRGTVRHAKALEIFGSAADTRG
jgi:hypothetical protein